jgi:hypothetical protein
MCCEVLVSHSAELAGVSDVNYDIFLTIHTVSLPASPPSSSSLFSLEESCIHLSRPNKLHFLLLKLLLLLLLLLHLCGIVSPMIFFSPFLSYHSLFYGHFISISQPQPHRSCGLDVVQTCPRRNNLTN